MQRVTAVGLTDVGRQRDHNEDSFQVAEELDLYVVCDGMGGHASGEVASEIACAKSVEYVADHPVDEGDVDGQADMLSKAVQHANDRVYIEGMKDPKLEGMGTTFVGIRCLPTSIVLVHVGDSRIYRWSESDGIEQMTRDHSLLNYKIDRGELTTDEEIANFKQGNVIVRAVGLKDWVEPEVQYVQRRPGDLYMLCSDGLTDLVDDWSISNVLEANFDDLQEAAECLIRMANNAGGKDNITILLARIDDPPGAALPAYDVDAEEATDPSGLDPLDDEVTPPRGVPEMDDVTPPRGVPVMDEVTPPRGVPVAADDYGGFRQDYRNDFDEEGFREDYRNDLEDDDYEDTIEEPFSPEDIITDPALSRVDPAASGRDLPQWAQSGVEQDDTITDPSLPVVKWDDDFAEDPGLPTRRQAPGFDDSPVEFGAPSAMPAPTPAPPGRIAAKARASGPAPNLPSVNPPRRATPPQPPMPPMPPGQAMPAKIKVKVQSSAKKEPPKPPEEEPPSIIVDDSLLD